MFKNVLKLFYDIGISKNRKYSQQCLDPPSCRRVTICGAHGRLGQYLAFLLKQSPLVNPLVLHDNYNVTGIAMDVAHIDTSCKVQCYIGQNELKRALTNTDVVVLAGGCDLQCDESCPSELMKRNSPLVQNIVEECIKTCPKALIGVLTNPINSVVPMITKMYQKAGCFEPTRIFGIVSDDTMTATSIVVQELLGSEANPAGYLVPVIGGHSPESMVPILSQTNPCIEMPECLHHEIVCKIKKSSSLLNIQGSSLKVALSSSRFINNLIRGLNKEPDVYEIAYIYNSEIPGVEYFATPFELGPKGVEKNLGMIQIDQTLEKPYVCQAVEQIKQDTCYGLRFYMR